MAPRGVACVCGAPALYRCDWPIIRPVEAAAADVRVGETMLSPRTGALAVVIEVILAPECAWIRVQFRQRRRPPFPEYTYSRAISDPMRVMRLAPCEASVCDAHVREVGDDRHHCQSHWDAWERREDANKN